ncbi:MAG: hypothetical protein BWY98_00381 [Tenericutes bacterium ADurb.BinA155]|nr:MAG: hypothetical protein BWY98_00381 [Tenericutes bacterium ADurb.BinA155]
MAAGLLDVATFGLASLPDRLAVVDLRGADIDFDSEFAAHPFDENVELKFADAGDDGLTGFLVRMDAEGRILFGEFGEGNAHLFLIGFGLRLHRLFKDGFGEDELFKNDWAAFIAEGIAGGRGL